MSALPDDWPKSPLWDVVSHITTPTLPAVVVAHRGDSQNAPENTLGAFAQAIAHGAECIEFDVQQSASGDLIVIHDDKVDRTTDGKGEVHRMETTALQELSAGSWFAPRYADERLPTLDEALDLMKGRAVPLIEVKVKTRRSPDAGVKAAEALKRHGMERAGIIICRELARVEEVRQTSPETPLAYLTFTKRQARNATRLVGVTGVDCYWKSLSLSLVETLRQASFFLTPWTVNRAADIDRLLLLGCEAIISDSPAGLRDRIEGFEFERALELHERFRRGETDLDLEQDREAQGEAPEDVARAEGTPSELEMDVDWPEDPPG